MESAAASSKTDPTSSLPQAAKAHDAGHDDNDVIVITDDNESILEQPHTSQPSTKPSQQQQQQEEEEAGNEEEDEEDSDGEDDGGSRRRPQRLVVVSPQTQRRVVQAEIFFLDYYYDLITYIAERKKRLRRFRKHVVQDRVPPEQADVEWRYYCGQERAFLRKRRTRLRFSEFEVLLQIGEGGYGQVFLARRRDTHELCAVKRMDKRVLIRRNRVDSILTERDVLTSAKSPWLVKLLYSFQDQHNVYLAMEFVPGGDMRSLLNHVQTMREEPARFYMAEMVLAMASLHSLGYLHRDLKPENYLIDEKGHIKLTDFGLAKGSLRPEWLEELKIKLEQAGQDKVVQRSSFERRAMYRSLKMENKALAHSFVGTPDYMAPELLYGHGYDYLVDYWAMGCILFEMLFGYSPFVAPTVEEVFVLIKFHEDTLQRPDYGDLEEDVSAEAWNLITNLLSPRGQRPQSLEEIQRHPWFDGVDWERLREGDAPFVPELASPDDTRYFDKDGFGSSRLVAVEDDQGNKTYARKAFLGFTYKHQGWQNTALKKHVLQEVRQMARSTPVAVD